MKITGIDSKQTTTHIEQEKLISDHINQLRKFQHFAWTPIILIPENQTGFFHTQVAHYASSQRSVSVLHQNGGRKAGVTKTSIITADYVTNLSYVIGESGIAFDRQWFTNTPKKGTKDGVLHELRDQVLRFGYDEKKKLTGKFSGWQDDLCIALMMIFYWSKAVERTGPSNPYNILKGS